LYIATDAPAASRRCDQGASQVQGARYTGANDTDANPL
jgi:hypothetical protein